MLDLVLTFLPLLLLAAAVLSGRYVGEERLLRAERRALARPCAHGPAAPPPVGAGPLAARARADVRARPAAVGAHPTH